VSGYGQGDHMNVVSISSALPQLCIRKEGHDVTFMSLPELGITGASISD